MSVAVYDVHMATDIAGAPGRNGLAELRQRQQEWDERPAPWWAADRIMAERVAFGQTACGEHTEYTETCGPCRMYAVAAYKRGLAR